MRDEAAPILVREHPAGDVGVDVEPACLRLDHYALAQGFDCSRRALVCTARSGSVMQKLGPQLNERRRNMRRIGELHRELRACQEGRVLARAMRLQDNGVPRELDDLATVGGALTSRAECGDSVLRYPAGRRPIERVDPAGEHLEAHDGAHRLEGTLLEGSCPPP